MPNFIDDPTKDWREDHVSDRERSLHDSYHGPGNTFLSEAGWQEGLRHAIAHII